MLLTVSRNMLYVCHKTGTALKIKKKKKKNFI